MNKNIIEPQQLIYKLKDSREAFPRLALLEKYAPKMVKGFDEVQKLSREYGEKYIEPVALDLDERIEKEHDYFHWDLVYQALPYRFLSLIIPQAYGGEGRYTAQFTLFMEELCSFCAGIANVFGAHALGLAPIFLSPDSRHYEKYMREITTAEKKGEPVIFALAITEPEAGSDMEDSDYYQTARIMTRAKKVKDGYIINGTKIFISNGSIARYVWVGAMLEKTNGEKVDFSFIVRNDTPGFSVGRIEKKMGQRACPAAELVFEDVFIPEQDRVGEEGEGEKLTTTVLGVSRAPVAAIATGIARGAFERLLKYLNETKVNGSYLFEHQRIQITLVDLMSKIQMARQLYMDAAMFADFAGFTKLMDLPIMKIINHLPDIFLNNKLAKKIFQSQSMYKFVRNLAEKKISEEDIAFIATYSSIAKYVASDLAMEVCTKALEIMGPDGPIHEYGIEKAYRDAKLTQIYEGTNQINRLFVYKNSLT